MVAICIQAATVQFPKAATGKDSSKSHGCTLLPKEMMWSVTPGQCNMNSQCLRYTDCCLNMTCRFHLWPSIYTKSFNFPKRVLSSAAELPVYPNSHNWTQNKVSKVCTSNSLHSRNILNTSKWVHWSFNHQDKGAFTQSLVFSNLLTPFVSIFESQFIKCTNTSRQVFRFWGGANKTTQYRSP